MSTLIEIKKQRKLTNKQISKSLKLSLPKTSALLHGSYIAIMSLNNYIARDLADILKLDYLAMVDALEASYQANGEEIAESRRDDVPYRLNGLRRSM